MAKLKFDARTPLYTSDGKAWRLDQFSEVLTRVGASGKRVVFFLHGRGKEPNKSLYGGSFVQGLAVHKIEQGYQVEVIMINWDLAFRGLNIFDRERALGNTVAAGKMLAEVASKLHSFQQQNPQVPKPALLVHSMGSIVVESALRNGLWPAAAPLFSAVVLSQPDADERAHDIWLEQLARRERVYVTLNRDDKVLQRATDGRPQDDHALGLGVGTKLAASAKYVDLTNMGPLGSKDDDHEVFGKGAMNGQIYVCQFFTQALTGASVVLELGANVSQIERGAIFHLKSRSDAGAPCLKIPALPKRER